MKPFSIKEILVVTIIFIIVAAVTGWNMRAALRRARDAQRREDIGVITEALNIYRNDFGFVPPAENGYIRACRGEKFEEVVARLKTMELFDRDLFFEGLKTCSWGEDPFKDLLEENNVYLKNIPQDPREKEFISYLYLSNGNRYQIYAYLEGEEEEVGFDRSIVARNLKCGKNICNFGKALPGTPLDRSIEEYEKELLEKASGNH